MGSNQYRCAECGKKVDTLKRTCLKQLPPTLVVILSRFQVCTASRDSPTLPYLYFLYCPIEHGLHLALGLVNMSQSEETILFSVFGVCYPVSKLFRDA